MIPLLLFMYIIYHNKIPSIFISKTITKVKKNIKIKEYKMLFYDKVRYKMTEDTSCVPCYQFISLKIIVPRMKEA